MIPNEIMSLALNAGGKQAGELLGKFGARVASMVGGELVALGIIHCMGDARVPINDIPEADREKVAGERMLRNKVVEATCLFAASEVVSLVTGCASDTATSTGGDDACGLL